MLLKREKENIFILFGDVIELWVSFGGLTFSQGFYCLSLSEGFESITFTVEFDDVKGLFQTKLFCDSMFFWLN